MLDTEPKALHIVGTALPLAISLAFAFLKQSCYAFQAVLDLGIVLPLPPKH